MTSSHHIEEKEIKVKNSIFSREKHFHLAPATSMGNFQTQIDLIGKWTNFMNFVWSCDCVRQKKRWKYRKSYANSYDSDGGNLNKLRRRLRDFTNECTHEEEFEWKEKFPCGEVKWKVLLTMLNYLPRNRKLIDATWYQSVWIDSRKPAREKNLISSTLNDVRKENSQIVTVRPSFCCAMFIFQTIVKKKWNWGRRIEVG